MSVLLAVKLWQTLFLARCLTIIKTPIRAQYYTPYMTETIRQFGLRPDVVAQLKAELFENWKNESQKGCWPNLVSLFVCEMVGYIVHPRIILWSFSLVAKANQRKKLFYVLNGSNIFFITVLDIPAPAGCPARLRSASVKEIITFE